MFIIAIVLIVIAIFSLCVNFYYGDRYTSHFSQPMIPPLSTPPVLPNDQSSIASDMIF